MHRNSAVPSDDPLDQLVDRIADRLIIRLKSVLARPEPGEPKRAFRTAEVAELLSISDSEVRELVSHGEIDSIKIGRVRLVPASAIDAFITRKLADA